METLHAAHETELRLNESEPQAVPDRLGHTIVPALDLTGELTFAQQKAEEGKKHIASLAEAEADDLRVFRPDELRTPEVALLTGSDGTYIKQSKAFLAQSSAYEQKLASDENSLTVRLGEIHAEIGSLQEKQQKLSSEGPLRRILTYRERKSLHKRLTTLHIHEQQLTKTRTDNQAEVLELNRKAEVVQKNRQEVILKLATTEIVTLLGDYRKFTESEVNDEAVSGLRTLYMRLRVMPAIEQAALEHSIPEQARSEFTDLLHTYFVDEADEYTYMMACRLDGTYGFGKALAVAELLKNRSPRQLLGDVIQTMAMRDVRDIVAQAHHVIGSSSDVTTDDIYAKIEHSFAKGDGTGGAFENRILAVSKTLPDLQSELVDIPDRDIHPQVYREADIYTDMYVKLNPPPSELVHAAHKAFQESIDKRRNSELSTDTYHIFEPSPDLRRQHLAAPPVNILRDRTGALYYEFVFGDRLRIVTEPSFSDSDYSLPMVHAFVRGRNNLLLDLISLQREERQSLFSFSDSSSAPTAYCSRVSSIIFLPMSTAETASHTLEWDPDDFINTSLHEMNHARFLEQDLRDIQTLKSHEFGHISGTVITERRADLGLLQMVQRVNRFYPESAFFDLAQEKSWVEEQLKGYDNVNARVAISPHYRRKDLAGSSVVPYAASNDLRRKYRASPRERALRTKKQA